MQRKPKKPKLFNSYDCLAEHPEINERIPLVYVSGPIRGDTEAEALRNIKFAELVARQLWDLGFAVHCPHLNTFGFEPQLSTELTAKGQAIDLSGDFKIISRCDAVLTLPKWSFSWGACAENAFADEYNIPVFSAIEPLVDWVIGHRRLVLSPPKAGISTEWPWNRYVPAEEAAHLPTFPQAHSSAGGMEILKSMPGTQKTSENSSEESENPKDLIGQRKPNLTLIPPVANIMEARAMADGADKYGPFNWRKNRVCVSVYVAAALRHLARFMDGETYDPDSKHGATHLACARACTGILIDAIQGNAAIDDRPPCTFSAGQAIDEFVKAATERVG